MKGSEIYWDRLFGAVLEVQGRTLLAIAWTRGYSEPLLKTLDLRHRSPVFLTPDGLREAEVLEPPLETA